MRIVLADPLPQGAKLEMNYPNLGLLYISNYLRTKASDIEVHYLNPLRTEHEYMGRLAEIRPDIVGLSFTTMGATAAYETARKIRSILPEAFLVAGGAHSTIRPEEVLLNSPVDVVAIGEGEETMLEIVEHVRNGRDLKSVAGIAYCVDGEVRKTDERQLVQPLDNIPFPAWDLVKFEDFQGPPLRRNSPATALLTSRGCPYRCGFCSNPVWRVAKPWMRKRSPENIAEEIQYLYDRGIREIYIRADEFNVSEPWAVDVCKAIKELQLEGLSFQCNLTVSNVTDRLAAGLREINCWLVHVGIESANQRVLDGIRKKQTVAEIISTCSILKKHGLKVFGFFMMFQAWEDDGRLEFETPDEVRETLRFIGELSRRRLVDYISWQFATPIPGAPLFEVATKHGLIPSKDSSRYPADMWSFNMELPSVSSAEMKKLRRQGLLMQARLALRNGMINWRHWGKIKNKIRLLLKSI